jgi:hypothetical protein
MEVMFSSRITGRKRFTTKGTIITNEKSVVVYWVPKLYISDALPKTAIADANLQILIIVIGFRACQLFLKIIQIAKKLYIRLIVSSSDADTSL